MPTYPPAHKRVQFTGTLLQADGGGSEVFDFGWADHSTMTIQDIAPLYLARMQTAWTVPNNSISSKAKLLGVRVEDVGADGKVIDSFYSGGTQPVGSSVGANCTVLSHCLTLETNNLTGKGRNVRGRFYPPAYMSVAGATAAIGDIQSYASAWSGLFAGFLDDGLVPAVASITNGGQIAPVTAISAATVIDTVRRRRNHVTVQRSDKYPVSS